MKKKFAGMLTILKKTVKEWNADDPFRQSAVIAYYAIFSLPALLVLIINVAGFFFEKEAVSGEVSRQVEGVMGPQTAEQIEEIIEKAGETKAGWISGIIAVLTLIFGATGVFVQLQKSLNNVWEVKEKPDLGFMVQLKNRLFSFGLILSIGFLLLVSLVVSSVLAAASHWLEGILPDVIAYLLYVVEFVVSIGVISVLFALMFKFLPDVKMAWNNVWVGAFVTGFLFILGKYGLSLYFGKAEPASVYGAAGSVVLVLLWVSYSSMIVFFGAEFTKQYTVYHKGKIVPTKNAEPIENSTGPADQDQKKKMRDHNGGQKQQVVIDNKFQNSTGFDHHHSSVHHHKGNGNGHAKDAKAEIKLHEELIRYEQKKEMDNKTHKVGSLKELRQMIDRKESRLESDKEGIVDNLKFSHILSGMIPKAFRVRRKLDQKLTVDDYLRHVAKRHIVTKEETFMDKVKEFLHIDQNGST
jgi:membrane protein